MSRRNKVNPDHYTIAGRLAPDDLARERRKQAEQQFGTTRGGQQKPLPPWMANEAAGNGDDASGGDQGNRLEDADAEPIEGDEGADAVDVGAAHSMNDRDADEAAQQPKAKPRSGATGKQQAGGGNRKKTTRRTREKQKQATRSGTTRGAKSAAAKRRATPKASGASGTPRSGKAAKARGSAARRSSPQRAGTPKAHATKGKGAKAKKAKKAKKR
jgi:hypothetical protein